MTKSSSTVLSALFLLSLAITAIPSVASAEDSVTSRITSTFGGWFKNKEESAEQDVALVPSPPADLTRQGSGEERGSRIIFAQSKRELGAAIRGNTRAIGENSIRVQELQEQMRQITGRVEQLVFELQRVQEQLRIMQEEAALSDGGDSVQRADASGEGDNPEDERGGDASLHPSNGGLGNDQPVVAGTAPLDLGAAGSGSFAAPSAESGDPLLQPNGTPSLGTLRVSPESDPDGLYNLGYSQLLNGDYEAAETNLRKFVQTYPNHVLAPNGRYWLAETYFARGQFADAVQEFSGTYRAFPTSNKAPDSLLKLGLSLAKLREYDAACATLAEVFNRFPDASRSIHIAARDEQSRSNCT
ncbi:MAG: tol-pal system protein YbgF [Pseudomonadota bacterium]